VAQVGKHSDPATARRGETLYEFVPRSVVGHLQDGAAAELQRLRAKDILLWSPRNRCWPLALDELCGYQWFVLELAEVHKAMRMERLSLVTSKQLCDAALPPYVNLIAKAAASCKSMCMLSAQDDMVGGMPHGAGRGGVRDMRANGADHVCRPGHRLGATAGSGDLPASTLSRYMTVRTIQLHPASECVSRLPAHLLKVSHSCLMRCLLANHFVLVTPTPLCIASTHSGA